MKPRFIFTTLCVMLFFSVHVAAQYSNATLNGAWYAGGFNPDTYMIFDGNGNITELGAYDIDNNGVKVGTYSVTPTGGFTGAIVTDGQTYQITGQFVNSDSIGNIRGSGMSSCTLTRISNPGMLSGKWTGDFNGVQDNFAFELGASGKIINDTKVVAGHFFVKNGNIIGFKSGNETDCWNEARFTGTYGNNVMSGTAYSSCSDITCTFTCTRENETSVNVSAGGLSSMFSDSEKETTTDLGITGTIDARDFKTMRDEMPNLKSVDLSEATIAEYTGLGGTYSSGSYHYPANSIPRNAFYIQGGNQILTNFVFPGSLKQISRSAFRACKSLSNIEIPSSVTNIDTTAFYNCFNLISVEFNYPSSLTSVGYFAFGNCTQLTQVFDISPDVVTIGDYAFLGSSVFITVNDANANYSSYDGVLYDKNKTKLMFVSPSKEGEVNIPSTVKTIEIDAFYNCAGLTSVTIPSSVKTISDWSFENCSGLSTITLPASIETIGYKAFVNCTGLTTVYTESKVPVDLSASDSVFYNVDVDNCVLWVPTGSKSAYQNAVQWKDFKQITEYNLTEIQKSAKNEEFNVYPNPSNGIIYIQSSGNSVIKIYSSSGILIKSFKSENPLTRVDISSFPSGLYIIKQQYKSEIKAIKSFKQ